MIYNRIYLDATEDFSEVILSFCLKEIRNKNNFRSIFSWENEAKYSKSNSLNKN